MRLKRTPRRIRSDVQTRGSRRRRIGGVGSFFARRDGPARDAAASPGAAVIDDASTRTWWMREGGEREGVDVTRRLCKALGHL